MNSINKIKQKRGTILVIDDDPAVLILIHAIFSGAGYRVVPAVSGDDAIRLARQRHLHIDVALLDVHMPRMRPRELVDEILSVRPKLPFLFMSGLLDDEVVRIRVLDGYAGFLPKPFHPASLLRVVQEAMETPQATALVASA